MSRLYRYYQERANEVALLGGMVNILAFVGIVININDMKETQKMEQMLLSKQWVSIKKYCETEVRTRDLLRKNII